jgi:hypothetical protein
LKDNDTHKLKSWLDFQTSFYKCQLDRYGTPRTFRQILFSDFACNHEAFICLNPNRKKDEKGFYVKGFADDLENMGRLIKPS